VQNEEIVLGPMGGGIVRLIIRLEEELHKAQQFPKLSLEDLEDLTRASTEIRPAFVALASQIIEPLRNQDDGLPELAYELLWRFTSVLVRVGAHVVVTDSTKFLFADQISREKELAQARVAQKGKSAKALERRVRLFAAIKEEAQSQKRALSKGEKFARMVRPGVRRRLGLASEGNDWPSIPAIRHCVTKPPESA
jgi:hypothetical protein